MWRVFSGNLPVRYRSVRSRVGLMQVRLQGGLFLVTIANIPEYMCGFFVFIVLYLGVVFLFLSSVY